MSSNTTNQATISSGNNNQNLKTSEFGIANFVPLFLIFVIFYIFIIRPQSKKHKEHQKIIESLKNGDSIITSSGIVAKIHSIQKDKITAKIEIAEGVIVEITRNSIADLFIENKATTNHSNKKNKKETAKIENQK